MILLLDENMSHDLREPLDDSGHRAFTTQWKGWKGKKNGELLRLAADEGIEALITFDGTLPDEQNLKTLPMAVVVLHLPDDDATRLMELLPALLDALRMLQPRTVVHVV